MVSLWCQFVTHLFNLSLISWITIRVTFRVRVKPRVKEGLGLELGLAGLVGDMVRVRVSTG
jgi:hypothetical protein